MAQNRNHPLKRSSAFQFLMRFHVIIASRKSAVSCVLRQSIRIAILMRTIFFVSPAPSFGRQTETMNASNQFCFSRSNNNTHTQNSVQIVLFHSVSSRVCVCVHFLRSPSHFILVSTDFFGWEKRWIIYDRRASSFRVVRSVWKSIGFFVWRCNAT